jgi:transposase
VAPDYEWFIGIDWGSETHEFCAIDAGGRILGTRTVAHTAAAVHEAFHWVQQVTGARPAQIPVALETRWGVLVDTCLEYGFPTFAINPKQLDRFRDRFTAGGAKDDRRDAWVSADGLRTDPRAFRPIAPTDPRVLQLRELCRVVDDLQTDERRLTNRLREQLLRVHAAWLTLSPAADDPWLWTVLATTPHPDAWAQLPRRRISPALRAHRIRRLSADDIVTQLRQPRLSAAPGVADAVETRIVSVVPQLLLLHQQRLTAERQIEQLLERLAGEAPAAGEPGEHRDVEILRSLPGVGRMVTATMLTEAAGLLANRDYSTLRAYTGVAPITRRSGKRFLLVQMRYACNPRLRQALFHWARISIQHDAAARRYYDQLRARGHQHARALRSVADRWLRILVALLKHRTLYDPTRLRPLSI